MATWQKIFNLYRYDTKNNAEFLNLISKHNLNIEVTENQEKEIKNKDLFEISDLSAFIDAYRKNKAISTRMGLIESSFILNEKFNLILDDHNKSENLLDSTYKMKSNTGFYYIKDEDKEAVKEWWIRNTISAIKKSFLTSCFCVLHYDLILWAHLQFKRPFFNWGLLPKILLQESANKKLLYIGSGIKSIQCAYDRNVQKAWRFQIPSFKLSVCQTPQTTTGMYLPDSSIKETTEKLVDKIVNELSDFDTAILGCGAYGPPLINLLSEKLPEKNLIYLGSACYTMFGIYSHEMPIQCDNDSIPENWIEVVEELDPKCGHIDGGKYWRK